MRTLLLVSFAITLAACAESESPSIAEAEVQTSPATAMTPAVAPETGTLAAILANQPDDVQARYQYRHPAETLTFFGIEPGMTVVEALPGGGWYSKLLIPYLGDDGTLIGANYATDMRRLFGSYSEERLQELENWTSDWPIKASEWLPEHKTSISAFFFGSTPETAKGSADAVLFVRALHNLARFENQGGYLTTAIADAYQTLKPGGVVGIVQHQMRESEPDEWADGRKGYLKQSFVINQMENAGFIFEGASDVNANPKDQPKEGDAVWRLAPSLAGSGDDPAAAAAMRAIGESNRMTLKFRKPAA